MRGAQGRIVGGRGTGAQGRIGGGRGTGGRRRKGGKQDPKVAGTGRKGEKISQYFVTFYDRNRAKRREPLRKGAGSGSERYGRREFQTPMSPPTDDPAMITDLLRIRPATTTIKKLQENNTMTELYHMV